MKLNFRRRGDLSATHEAAGGVSPLDAERFHSSGEWLEHIELHREKYERRRSFEQAVQALDKEGDWSGWCGLCAARSDFVLPSRASGQGTNFREELVCTRCGMNSRVRGALQIALGGSDLARVQVYITEQSSPTFVWLQRHLEHVHGSEYTHDPSVLRAMKQYVHDLGGHGDIRFEDVTGLSFADASLDVIASFDVLEHVPDYKRAMQEFFRVLRDGGRLVLTAPFIGVEQTLVRARVSEDGAIEHLLPPEYHGDPLKDGGILCFYHFGWDLLEVARASGFSEACMSLPWSPAMGLMGDLWTLTAVRRF